MFHCAKTLEFTKFGPGLNPRNQQKNSTLSYLIETGYQRYDSMQFRKHPNYRNSIPGLTNQKMEGFFFPFLKMDYFT